jgi:hypothetical protein
MAIPLIAAGIAARAIASKLATRAIGGITGAGAKTVTPVYRNMNTGSVKKTYDVTKSEQKMFNKMKTEFVNDRKSGATAKKSAAIIEKSNLQGVLSGKTGDPKIIKINSNPTRAR